MKSDTLETQRGDIQTDGRIGETWPSVVSGGFDVLRRMGESDEK